MVTGNEIVRCAEKEVGYKEGKNKDNKYGKWFGLNNDKWCMEFVQWIYHACGLDLPLKTASCGSLLRWYQRNQPECIVDKPFSGCIAIFDWPKTKYDTDHTGIYVESDKNTITTIDGNTKNRSDGNDSNGGWVQKRTRKWNEIDHIWYISPKGLVDMFDWDKAISEMTKEQAYRLYTKAVDYMVDLPLPSVWNAADNLEKAKKLGITYGANMMRPASLLECSTMIVRYDEEVKKK